MFTGLLLIVASAAPVQWTLADAVRSSAPPAEIVGRPEVRSGSDGAYVRFDGREDGLIFPSNPLAGWAAFTICVKMRPAVTGVPEQRFMHLESADGHRIMLETRLAADGTWALDSYLYAGDPHRARQLLDRKLRHPCRTWHWVTLTYADGRVTNFVDGRRELSGAVDFPPLGPGRVGVGFRLNHLYWFSGDIQELRFYPFALPPNRIPRL